MYMQLGGKTVHITNRMKDGTIRESMDGYVVPVNETTLPAYHLIAQACIEKMEEEAKKKEK
ncbi:BOW99_gp33 family protein [Caproicibacterium sp. BJN0003]|jgi:hypothetical protein|uniref:BOW99_gp33 family protein n=1 Tax=Caproicibacterium sp. BJN0003 TaxID=2994078 RepID=UPI00224FE149|nr:hypothetical protein [Caproicibacterium sp. BJN0003]UZT82664.1 hypothetical protein OP489_02300 [Caproicibacterium sp. BJN0003]